MPSETIERAIVELPDSTALLGDCAALCARWDADGVLFFRDVVGHDAIRRVREEYLARLREVEVVPAGAATPRWNGRDRIDGTRATPIADATWRELVADPGLDRVVRTFLGEAPAWVPIVVHRAAPPTQGPGASDDFAMRHQDGPFNYGIDFVTCWVPLMDIDDTVGGLAVVPGSHKASLYPSDPSRSPGQRVGIPAGAIPDTAWRRPDYRVGDILMFHSMTAHAGLPNRSDQLRLSIDIRFLPGSVARPVVGHATRIDEGAIELRGEQGEAIRIAIGERTVVRGPKGHPVIGEDRAGVLFAGANLIVVPDERGEAKLIRSVSRKYVDLPAAWFETLPADWVR